PLHRQLHSSRLPQATPPSPTRRSSDLADPTRRKVFERLRSGPKPVGRIARGLPVSRPAVSQHLKVLKEAGLVTDRPEGTRRVYYIDPEGLGALRVWLDRFWDDALAAFQAQVENEARDRKERTR